MISQVSLFDQKPVEPWSERCCKACWNALGEKCVCKCNGEYHGKGKAYASEELLDKNLPEQTAALYRKFMTNSKCHCGKDLAKEPIRYYGPHSGGYTISGFPHKVWLYVRCPFCYYDMALWKMGVTRE